MDRRTFLGRTAAAGGAFAFSSLGLQRIARAAAAQDQYFVFCYFEGGWDLLLGLDPRDPSVFSEAAVPETGVQPGYDRLPPEFPAAPVDAGPFTLGPCIGELAALADHFSVVRGINMATLTHEVGRRYFITGRPPSGLQARGSAVAALATAQLGADRPVPYLTHRVETYAEDLPPYATAMPVAAVDHLRFILREDLGIPSPIRTSVHDAVRAYQARERSCRGRVGDTGLAAAYRFNRERALGLVTSGLWSQFEFDQPLLAPVRAHYGFTPELQESPYGRAALAAQAIKTGLSRVVAVALAADLDTHDGSWAGQHSVRLQAGFDALARLMTDLRDTEAPGGGSLLSRTTLVAYSEFGRTAKLNERQGRDHNLCNAALVAGPGIASGRVVGASSDYGLGPELIDLATGQRDPAGVSLKPEHVLATALGAAGLDATSLRAEPIAALLA